MKPTPSTQKDARRFANTDRDEETLGKSKGRENDPGLAAEDTPQWQPPESVPEPRPADPIMNSSQTSTNPNTISPT